MSAHHCPTCGCPVRIGGKGTTHYYVPISSKAADALLAAAKLIKESMVIRSFQRGGVSYGGDKRTISQEAWDVLCVAISAYEED